MVPSDYLYTLRREINDLHDCAADHLGTMFLPSLRDEETGWDGAVELFALNGHPEAKRCFAWGHEKEGKLRCTIVLELPPVDSPQAAVQAARDRAAGEGGAGPNA